MISRRTAGVFGTFFVAYTMVWTLLYAGRADTIADLRSRLESAEAQSARLLGDRMFASADVYALQAEIAGMRNNYLVCKSMLPRDQRSGMP